MSVGRGGPEGSQSRLTITITTEQAVSEADGADRLSRRELPDGTVVDSRESRYSTTDASGVMTPTMSRSVTVTRTSGTRVEVSSIAGEPAQPLSTAQLEAIALVPGLEVS